MAVFEPSGPTGPVLGMIGPPVIRDGTVTQVTMSPSTDGLNLYLARVQVQFSDPNGTATVTLADREIPKPIVLGQKVKVVFGVKIEQA